MTEITYYTNGRKDLHPFIPKQINKTLDIGCATGAFSTNLQQMGASETWGVEMDRESAEIARTKLQHVLNGSFDEVYDQLPKNYFDCVFFNDVLEHMTDPEECLKKVKGNLNPQGKILASIPNMRQIDVLKKLIFKKDWKYEDAGILDRTHLRFFTKKSIIRMMDDCGYKIDRIEGINSVGRYCLTSILNILLLNSIEDVKHVQFVVIASPK